MDSPFFRPTRAIIDLKALEHNLRTLKKLVSDSVEILAMVKADAYGHGAVPVSKKLTECGVASLGVATVEEGLELRNAGISSPILVMGGLMGMGSTPAGIMVGADLTPVVHSAAVCDLLERVASAAKKRIAVHIKVDTGMGRLGARPEALPKLLESLAVCKWISVEGVMTHLAKASDKEFTSSQMSVFLKTKETIEEKLGAIDIWHTANSIAAIRGDPLQIPSAKRCWARLGIALYGLTNGEKLPKGLELKPVLQIVSKIVLLKHVPQGTPVSYGCTFVTKRPSYIAVVPIGYADGYPFSLSGKALASGGQALASGGQAQALVHGKRASVVGRVTMDMIMLDVTDIENVSVGDDVVLVGNQGNEYIGADEIAEKAGTISYEILCRVSKRMPRWNVY